VLQEEVKKLMLAQFFFLPTHSRSSSHVGEHLRLE
jgi:hypothetical protein